MKCIPDPIDDLVKDISAKHVNKKGRRPGRHASKDKLPEAPVLIFNSKGLPEGNAIVIAESLDTRSFSKKRQLIEQS